MYLGAYLINGDTPINTILSYEPSDLQGNLPYYVADVLPDGYTDISSIENWDLYGERLVGQFANFRDYKKLRSEIKDVVFTKAAANLSKWDDLTDSEKRIAAKYILVPLAFRLSVSTMDENIAWGFDFNAQSREARYKRVGRVVSEMYNRMVVADAADVELDLNQVMRQTVIDIDTDTKELQDRVRIRIMVLAYVEKGREGTLEDADRAVGLFDYILSRTGTPFDGTGFSSKEYVVQGYDSCSDFGNAIMQILKYGNY